MKVNSDYFEDFGDYIQIDIWSFDLEVVVDYQGSMDRIVEHNDEVDIIVVNEKQEDYYFNEDYDHYYVYPHIIS